MTYIFLVANFIFCFTYLRDFENACVKARSNNMDLCEIKIMIIPTKIIIFRTFTDDTRNTLKCDYLTFALSWSNFYRRTRRICKAEFNLKSRFMCHTVLFLHRNCSSFLNYVSRSVLTILRFAFITSLVRFQVKIYCRETRGRKRKRKKKEGNCAAVC